MAFGGRSRPVKSEINVTPLVDVCLVLLIIFMVVTDKMARGKEVPLPKARHHTERPENTDDLIVSVTRQGGGGGRARIWWDREAVSDAGEVRRRLEAMREKPLHAVVKADANLDYAEVYPVLIALHEGGTRDLQLATQRMDSR